MSERFDFYQQQAKVRFSEVAWLRELQEQALADFSRLGFPTRHNEDWKYTPTDAFLKQSFYPDGTLTTSKEVSSPGLGLSIDYPITFLNGQVVGIDECASRLPPGVIVQTLSRALMEHPQLIQAHLGHVLEAQHGFQVLNTAMIHDGLLIYLPKDVELTAPIFLSHWQDEANQAVYLRHLVILEEGSSLQLIEDYQGHAQRCYMTNTVTEASLSAQATFTHVKIQRESQSAYHVGHLAVKQSANSQLESHSVSVGGAWVRSDITIRLQEPGARCLMNGIYTPMRSQHMDHHTVVVHDAPSCASSQDYKGILSGKSHAVFNGRVIVAKGAQHSEAKQQNKNLLLSKHTAVDTKPQLEIDADDVVCTHGATVGQLDEEALFYLATRGIGRAEASRYLVQAFFAENVRVIENKALAEWVSSLLNDRMKCDEQSD